jgi:hypothetical protein
MLMTLGSGGTVLTDASLSTWKKYVGGHRGVAGYSFGQFISFTIFVLLDVLYCESFEIVLHFFDETQISLEGGFPDIALFFLSIR